MLQHVVDGCRELDTAKRTQAGRKSPHVDAHPQKGFDGVQEALLRQFIHVNLQTNRLNYGGGGSNITRTVRWC